MYYILDEGGETMKITRRLFNVNGNLVTERELNAAKKVLPEIEVVQETYQIDMSKAEFLERAVKVEKEEV